MDIDAIQTTIATWVKSVVQLPVRWENKPDNVMTPMVPAKVILTGPMNIETHGVDYVQYATAGSDLQPTVIGHRQFDVGVRVIGRSQAGNKSAQFYLEKLRAALTRPSALATFGEAGLAVLQMSKGVSFDAPFEERFESIASATWLMTAVVADADDATVGVLTKVSLSSTIDGEDGSVLPSPPNVTDELISGE